MGTQQSAQEQVLGMGFVQVQESVLGQESGRGRHQERMCALGLGLGTVQGRVSGTVRGHMSVQGQGSGMGSR
jgi:hypothetical protein